jgi:hypothetical protein
VSSTLDVAESVSGAIAELEEAFTVSAEPTGDGGALVTVHALELGDRWQPNQIELVFEVAYNYPYAAIYPYFTTSLLNRADGGQWPTALQRVDWRGAPRTQISLRANRWNPQIDKATGAVLQVQRWFETAP